VGGVAFVLLPDDGARQRQASITHTIMSGYGEGMTGKIASITTSPSGL
jgi:hypothetical protein